MSRPPFTNTIVEGFEFISGHFEEPIWPRTISTHATEGRQILAYNKEEVIERYKQSSLLDCRINAYPDYTEYGGINRQAPNFLFLDLDRTVFESEKAFNTAFNKTLRNLSDILGPSTPGALNLVSGQTHGATPPTNISDNVANGSVIGDPRPTYDDCSKGITVSMNGKNIGNLLNSKNITWGWFQGGFKPTGKATDGKAICDSKHQNINGTMPADYIPHHEPFQYYNSTSNPHLNSLICLQE